MEVSVALRKIAGLAFLWKHLRGDYLYRPILWSGFRAGERTENRAVVHANVDTTAIRESVSRLRFWIGMSGFALAFWFVMAPSWSKYGLSFPGARVVYLLAIAVFCWIAVVELCSLAVARSLRMQFDIDRTTDLAPNYVGDEFGGPAVAAISIRTDASRFSRFVTTCLLHLPAELHGRVETRFATLDFTADGPRPDYDPGATLAYRRMDPDASGID